MFERRYEPLLPKRTFYLRLAKTCAATALVVAFSLALGSTGYHYLGKLPWIDALLNAAMILTGMGPVDPMRSEAAKLFATFYALYSGVAFLTMIAVLVAPILHRFLHAFHVETEDDQQPPTPSA
jgi:hypothetical protein